MTMGSVNVQIRLSLDHPEHAAIYKRLKQGYRVSDEARKLLALGMETESAGYDYKPAVSPSLPEAPVKSAPAEKAEDSDLLDLDFGI